VRDEPVIAKRMYQTWAVIGPSGAGKSSLCATADKPLFADSNQGLLSIADVEGLEHVRAVTVSSMADLDEIYDRCSGTAVGKKDWSKKYNTIIFDHFEDIQAIILDELVEKAMERDDRRDDTIEQREYGIMGNKLRRYIRKFKKLPMHKILILGTKVDFDSGQERPNLIGALQSQLPYLVDHTIYLQVKSNGRRILHLNESEHWYAKTRAHWLTPEQRKVPYRLDDMHCLSRLFALVAKGPTKTRASAASPATTEPVPNPPTSSDASKAPARTPKKRSTKSRTTSA